MGNLDSELLSKLQEMDRNYSDERKGRKRKSTKRDDVRCSVDLGDDEHPFSKVFGFVPPSGIDHAVRVFSPDDWHKDVRQYIPVRDTSYIFPKGETEDAVVAIMQGDTVLTTGPKGSGKTTLFQQICARMNLPWFRVNCRRDMESSTFFGTPSLESGTLSWVDGPLPLFGRHGGMVTADEISSTPSGIAMALMAPLEPNGPIYVPEKPVGDRYIKPHPWFRLSATDNTQLQGDTSGRYAGTNVQNEALIDRFRTSIKLSYLNKQHETEVIKSHVPNIPDEWVDHMLDIATIVRRAYDNGQFNFTISPRALVNWAQKCMYWGDIAKSFKLSFCNKLIDDDYKQIVEIFNKVTGANLNEVK